MKIILFLLIIKTFGFTFTSAPKPPVANKNESKLTKHEDVRIDEYFWMRNRDSKEVLSHIQAENEYANKVLSAADSVVQKMFVEMKERIKPEDVSEPVSFGNYFYFDKTVKDKEYSVYFRKKKDAEAKEELLLDVNELAKDKKYFDAHPADISPDQSMLAFVTDEVGRRFYKIQFKNLLTGEINSNFIEGTTGNWIWVDQHTGLFVRQDSQTLRANRVFKYDIRLNKTEELYHEKDELFEVSLSKSLTGNYIFLNIQSFNSTEVRYFNIKKPSQGFKIFLKREKNHEYSVEDGDDGFYINTNWKDQNFRLMKTSYDRLSKAQWKEVYNPKDESFLENFLVFKSNLVMQVRNQGLIGLQVIDRDSQKVSSVKFEDSNYALSLLSHYDYDAKAVRYSYSSLVQPYTVMEYNFSEATSRTIKVDIVPKYEKSLYESKQVWAKSFDGKMIPISIVYRKDKFKKGENPILVYGYGSYGISIDPEFDSDLISLLDRGFVYAIAHIRGGQELGRSWYDNGKMMAKKNTFSDFIFATEYLIREGFAKSGHVYMEGASAGGLLMGAVVNSRPDLYHGVHADVPFVDVLTTMLDETIPLTVAEYEQWGNPNEFTYYHYIKSYSPYDNVKPQKYPNMLITTGYHDSQVQYWEPLKWAARLRDNNKASTQIIIKTDMSAGHSGVTGRYAETYEKAEQYGYFAWLESKNK